MQAAVILVGDELLAGHTRDANGHYLAQRLTALGHRVRRIAVIPDEAHAIHEEVDLCMGAAELVFLCGGLGPTHDDRTTEALADRFGRRLVVDEPSWERLRARYGPRVASEEAVASARKMVTVPDGAEVVENPAGAAVAYVLREGNARLVVLPGVPAEMQAIFESRLVGGLVPVAHPLALVEVELEMAEALFAAPLSDVAREFGDVDIGSYPHHGERRVTLRFRGDGARAQAALDAFFARLPDARARVVAKPTATTSFNP